jgi:hypothetical protein
VHADLVGQALAVFGSFDRARAVAGLASPPLEHDADVIIGALRSLARSGVRLDVTTLSTMGESGLVAGCVDTFGSLAVAAAKAGLGAGPAPAPAPAPVPEQRRPPTNHDRGSYDRGDRGERGANQMGFSQPALSPDGQVSTALALETLQKTAVQLGRVPAARDLPPDVARRLTNDYGSVRFAYLALRIHSDGDGAQRTADSAAAAASEPVQGVTQEALEATARLLESVGIHRRNVEAAAQTALVEAQAAEEEAAEAAGVVDEGELDELWAQIERDIDEAAAAAGEMLRRSLAEALDHFVGEVTDMARHATLAALVPTAPADSDDEDAGADDDAGDDEES